MALTTIELFRASNKSGPRFDYFRPGEIVIQPRSGIDWVLAGQGGASTLEAPIGLGGTWYRLPQGVAYDDASCMSGKTYQVIGHGNRHEICSVRLRGGACRP
jgi:hypothetical protein